MANILIVDDEAVFARAIKRKLERESHKCLISSTVNDARQLLKNGSAQKGKFQPNLVLLDMRLPDGDGIELLTDIEDGVPVIVITAYGDIDNAISAMRSGASDYLRKPLDLKELDLVITRVLHTQEIHPRLNLSQARELHQAKSQRLIGESPSIDNVRDTIKKIAAIQTVDEEPPPNVLILGETGVGKDLAAHLIHTDGGFLGRPFVQVDCPALNHEEMDVQLFGKISPEASSPLQKRVGSIETAEDGTLFLNEISELPLPLQNKLLHVIEHRMTQPLGSTKESVVKARFVASSNRPLANMANDGSFRADLFYRLNVLTLELPPLRERREDIPLLATYFSKQTSRRYGCEGILLDESALEAMDNYNWPGNVRELRYLIERSVLLLSGNSIGAKELGLTNEPLDAEPRSPSGAAPSPNQTLVSAERDMIEKALADCKGNISKAARVLGVTRMTMRYRMEKHGIDGSE